MFCLPKTAWPPTSYWKVFLDEAPYQDQLDDMLTPFYTTCVDINASKLMGKVFQDTGASLDLKAELDTLAATADQCLSTSTSRIVAMSFCEPRSW